jgi:hypothetical protein
MLLKINKDIGDLLNEIKDNPNLKKIEDLVQLKQILNEVIIEYKYDLEKKMWINSSNTNDQQKDTPDLFK